MTPARSTGENVVAEQVQYKYLMPKKGTIGPKHEPLR